MLMRSGLMRRYAHAQACVIHALTRASNTCLCFVLNTKSLKNDHEFLEQIIEEEVVRITPQNYTHLSGIN